METLYLIGNGFDLHHKIPSSYRDYHKWLSLHKPDVANRLDEIYGTDNNWWSDFENSLGLLDINGYVNTMKYDAYPDISSDEYRDRDRFVMPDTAMNELSTLYQEVRNSFYEWVISLPSGISDLKIKIERKNSFFITFNYTETLQNLYNIPEKSVLHIHGKSNKNNELILGHGLNYDKIKNTTDIEAPTELKDPADIEQWYNENYDPIIEETTNNVINQVAEQRKNVTEIIAHNRKTFSKMTDISKIYAYGLSFSSVDLPYLDEIISIIDTAKTEWEINYFSDKDKQKIEQYMQSKGIMNKMYSLVKLEDLCLLKQIDLFD